MYDPDSDDEGDYDLEPDSDELDEYDEEDELDDMQDPRITELDDEDEVPALIEAKKESKAEKKGKNKRPAEDDTADAASIDTLIAAAAKKDEKLSKKQAKKLKKNDGSAVEAEAPSSSKSDKKVQFAKELEQGPTPTKDAKKEKAPSGPRTVQGVKIDDRKVGTGPAAKSGDRIGMRYIGKLEKDGKVFDSNKKGKPFTFKLGAGEVIKGWDIGIAGMSAGGERRITIPAHLAYGSKGTGPIPGNATLVFDVKLLEINKGK
jgi:FK506-binding nuclear protein